MSYSFYVHIFFKFILFDNSKHCSQLNNNSYELMSSAEEKDALTQLYMGIGESLEKLIGISFSTFGFQKLVLLVRDECINSKLILLTKFSSSSSSSSSSSRNTQIKFIFPGNIYYKIMETYPVNTKNFQKSQCKLRKHHNSRNGRKATAV